MMNIKSSMEGEIYLEWRKITANGKSKLLTNFTTITKIQKSRILG